MSRLSLSRHDKAMLAVTVCVALFGFLALTAKGRIALIRSRRAEAARLEQRIDLQTALIDAKDDWAARYEKVRDRMPVFSGTEQVGPYWGKIILKNHRVYKVVIIPMTVKMWLFVCI